MIFHKLMVALLLLTILVISNGCTRSFTVVKAQPKTQVNSSNRERYDPNRTPTVAEEHLHEGLILFRSGNFQQARHHFKQAIADNPHGWSGHYYLARVMMRQEEYTAAMEHLYVGLDLAPNEPRTRSDIYRSIAECLELQGELARAELNYRTALNLFPESTPAKQGLARLQDRDQTIPR